MDLKAIATELPLGFCLAWYGPGGAFTSKDPTPITANWANYMFGLTDSDLIPLIGSGPGWLVVGTGVPADTLAAVSKRHIRNDPGATPTPIRAHPAHK